MVHKDLIILRKRPRRVCWALDFMSGGELWLVWRRG